MCLFHHLLGTFFLHILVLDMFVFAIDFAMMLYVQLFTNPMKCAMWFAAP
jgi:hypothetical protein